MLYKDIRREEKKEKKEKRRIMMSAVESEKYENVEILKKESEIFKVIELQDSYKIAVAQLDEQKNKLYQELVELRKKSQNSDADSEKQYADFSK